MVPGKINSPNIIETTVTANWPMPSRGKEKIMVVKNAVMPVMAIGSEKIRMGFLKLKYLANHAKQKSTEENKVHSKTYKIKCSSVNDSGKLRQAAMMKRAIPKQPTT